MDKEAIKEKVKEILLSHGIKMTIGGCGCCGSPWVSFVYNGQTICDDCENFRITMINND